MIKFTDIIPGGPWAQEEMVQEQSNPALSGYGTLSPCCSTGLLYQQVLTPQVPPETEMGSWLGKLLTTLAESSEKSELKADFRSQNIIELIKAITVFISLFYYISQFLILPWMFFINCSSVLFSVLVCKKLDPPQVYKLILLSGSTQALELFIL